MRKGLVPVVALILLVAGSALAAPEVPVSDITFETSPSSKQLPALASGDGGYLAVWLDGRSGQSTLMATRVAATGEPLDPMGIPLGRAAYCQPQVLWNGESYLVFWNPYDSARLMVTRVSREGVADAPRVLRERAPLDFRARAVATNGTHIVLAYREDSGGGPMHVAVMTPDAVLIEDRIVDAGRSLMPTVVANGRDFLVAWSVNRPGEPYDIVALRLDFRGAAIDASPRKIGEGYGAEIVRNGSDYVAISPTGEGEPEYQSWRVSRDLTQVGAAVPLPLRYRDRVPSLLDGAPAMMVIFDVIDGTPGVSAVTFDGNGHETGPRKRMNESFAWHFAVARGDGAVALIEVEPYGGNTQTLTGSLFDDVTLSRRAPERLIALSATEQRDPAIAGGANVYLAVWGGPEGLKGGRFRQDGTRLDGNGFALDANGRAAAVVFDGERFVVSYIRWKNNRYDTVVRFVSPGDGLLPEEVLVERSPYSLSRPTLAAGDGVVLLAWTRMSDVHAAALRGTQLIAFPRKIADSSGVEPAASWSDGRFLVVWDGRDFDYDVYSSVRLEGMRLDRDLTPIDAQPRVFFARRGGGSKHPVLAAWNDGWLVAFEDGSDVRLHEIGANGKMTEMPFATMAGDSPKLVNTPSRPWLAWTAPGWERLHARPVRPDGMLDAAGALSIGAPSFGFGYHSAIGAIGDRIAATYGRVSFEAGTVQRVFISEPEKSAPGRRRSVR